MNDLDRYHLNPDTRRVVEDAFAAWQSAQTAEKHEQDVEQP